MIGPFINRPASPASHTVNRLMSYRKNVEQFNEKDDEKWHEKVIKSLVKKLKKSKMLDELERALTNEDPNTRCITILRSLDGRLQVSQRKCIPHVVYCRIWRFPLLQSHHQLRPVVHCQFPFVKKLDQVCINPYHFELVDNDQSASHDLSQNDFQVKMEVDEEVDETKFTKILENVCTNTPATISTPGSGPCSVVDPFSPISPEMENLTLSDVDRELQSCMDAHRGSFHNNELNDTDWCIAYYYELNQRIGEPFKGFCLEMTIDGFCSPSESDRFCLGALNNVNRNPGVMIARRQIGRGAQIRKLNGDVLIECLSESPIFVQSPVAATLQGDHAATVYRVPNGSTMKVFDGGLFREMLISAQKQGYSSLYSLQRICHLRVSFVKGWGRAYRRQTITATPCWVELHLFQICIFKPLRELDILLSATPADRTLPDTDT